MDVTSALLLYKTASLVAGTALCYLGYLLFCKGIWGQSGDLNAKFGSNKLILKSAAPGTFFVVLGTVVLLFTIFKGLDISQVKNTTNAGDAVIGEAVSESSQTSGGAR